MKRTIRRPKTIMLLSIVSIASIVFVEAVVTKQVHFATILIGAACLIFTVYALAMIDIYLAIYEPQEYKKNYSNNINSPDSKEYNNTIENNNTK